MKDQAMKVESNNLPPDMTEPSPDAREAERAPNVLSVGESVARLKAILAEAANDDEKRRRYFGYFQTSDGDL